MKRYCIIVFLIPLVLAACTPLSIQQIRSEPPESAAIVNGNYTEIGTCVAEGLQTGPRGAMLIYSGDLIYEIIHRESERRLSVTARNWDTTTIFDLLFIELPDRRTRIENRRGGVGYVKAPARLSEAAWPIVERCTGVTIEVNSAVRK